MNTVNTVKRLSSAPTSSRHGDFFKDVTVKREVKRKIHPLETRRNKTEIQLRVNDGNTRKKKTTFYRYSFYAISFFQASRRNRENEKWLLVEADLHLSLSVAAGQEAADLPLLSRLVHVHPQLSTGCVSWTVRFRGVVGVIDILSKNEISTSNLR